jgi:hypothetical protein
LWEKLSVTSAIVFGLTTVINDTPLAYVLDNPAYQPDWISLRAILTLLILASIPRSFGANSIQEKRGLAKAEAAALDYLRVMYNAADGRLDQKRMTRLSGDCWKVPV